jgi:hypothetical protein
MKTLRTFCVGILACLSMGAIPAGLAAQETEEAPPPPQRPRPDTRDLVFEREVFSYPQYERRNPFVPLVGTEEGGPRFEELILQGILFSPDSDRSVALFGSRTSVSGEGANQTPQAFRARRGQTLGNVRILEIQRTRVVVEVVEFGLTEQRIMELRRPGEGGSS